MISQFRVTVRRSPRAACFKICRTPWKAVQTGQPPSWVQAWSPGKASKAAPRREAEIRRGQREGIIFFRGGPISILIPAVFTAAIKHRFQGVDLEAVFFQNMLPGLIEYMAVQVQQGPALFAFKVKMLPAVLAVVDILIAGALPLLPNILADYPGIHQLLQVAVDGGPPDSRFPLLEILGDVVDRYVAIPQGGQILEDTFLLAGVIGGRAGMFHRVSSEYNMKMEIIFIL
jgi:hypothetical protein